MAICHPGTDEQVRIRHELLLQRPSRLWYFVRPRYRKSLPVRAASWHPRSFQSGLASESRPHPITLDKLPTSLPVEA